MTKVGTAKALKTVRETLYPQARLNLYPREKKTRSMPTKVQMRGQALSHQSRLFGSLETTPTGESFATTYSQAKGSTK